MRRSAVRALVLILPLALGACETSDSGPRPDATERRSLAPDLDGTWRAVLDSPGGSLPFGLSIEMTEDGYRAFAVNGEERAPFSHVELNGRKVRLAFDFYDSAIDALVAPDGQTIFGTWRRTNAGGGATEMKFLAERLRQDRFEPSLAPAAERPAAASIAGRWAAVFTDENGTEPAVAELRQTGTRIAGTILTPTGDYRYLDGSYSDGLLRLSTFDGAHAFLLIARETADAHLEGRFWSGDSYAATWQADRDEEAQLPSAWQQVRLSSQDGRFRFAFPDFDGEIVSSEDDRFRGKPVVVNIFGSWCPNCNDEAPVLAAWDRRHRGQGLQIVGLAYELTGNRERDARQVRRFAERHGIEYTLLLAGVSDKEEAGKSLPDLSAVLSYPTTIFIDRTGRVQEIHSGYAGPGAGSHHTALVAELDAALAKILATPGEPG